MKLEEIERYAKRCRCDQCKEKLYLISIIHHLKAAIEKHKKKIKYLCKTGNFPLNEDDRELYKAAEDL
jgi:hypothetical protein